MSSFKFNIIYLLSFLLLWQLITIVFNIPEYFIPSPIDIISVFINEFTILVKHTSVTVIESIIGMSISILLGIGFGILIDRYQRFKKIFLPIVTISQTTPMVIVSTLLIVIIGFGYVSKIVVIVILCTFPILIATYKGFEGIDQEYIEYFKSMKVDTISTYKYLKLPMIRNEIYSGIRISTTYLIGSAILAEYMGSRAGLGFYLSRAVKNFNSAEVFAVAVISILLTMISLKILDLVERRK